VYGWFPAISGSTEHNAQPGPPIDVSMGDVLDALKFTFMGTAEVSKGKWGLWTDLVYADFGASKQASRDFTIGQPPNNQLPVGIDANLVLDLKSWIWTIAGTYNVMESPDGKMDVLAGARLNDMETTLSWSLNGTGGGGTLPPKTGSGVSKISNWDGIVGLKGRVNFGASKRWFVPYYADIGTGESDLTWQLMAGVGYQFDWGSLVASWRYLKYDFKSSSPVQDLSYNGPLVGVVFRW
jgi:hypothetical protein